jgi:hypothetical protein
MRDNNLAHPVADFKSSRVRWEIVHFGDTEIVERFVVPGGWIYRTEAYSHIDDAAPLGIATAFVPAPGASA